MAKMLGYIIAAAGLVIALLSFYVKNIPALKTIPPTYLMIGGVVILIVGVALTLNKGKSKVSQEAEEVPIYRGNKIVGYRKADK